MDRPSIFIAWPGEGTGPRCVHPWTKKAEDARVDAIIDALSSHD